MGKKQAKEEYVISRNSSELIEILFGEKPIVDGLWEGSWNPAYRYKKKLERLPYYPLLRISMNKKGEITDIDIVFRPNYWKRLKEKKELVTESYNWVNPYFWLDNGFYPESNMRIEDEFYYINRNSKKYFKKPPVEEDFEIIFNDIWKICVIKEGKVSISQADFTNYIWLIRFLVENAILFPIKTIDGASWERYACQYLDEAESISIFEQNTQNLLKGWYITKKDTAEKIQATFLSDIKKILNLFFEKIKPDNGLGLFLYKIYGSFANELVRSRLFIKCSHCGLLADYLKGKKYCSLLTDGKNCGKKARNKRYYSTKGKERLPKYRQTTQELRAFYKEKGIKK